MSNPVMDCTGFVAGFIPRPRKTVTNCALARQNIRKGIGRPDTEKDENGDTRCLGYGTGDSDEPIEPCKRCRINNTYNDGRKDQ